MSKKTKTVAILTGENSVAIDDFFWSIFKNPKYQPNVNLFVFKCNINNQDSLCRALSVIKNIYKQKDSSSNFFKDLIITRGGGEEVNLFNTTEVIQRIKELKDAGLKIHIAIGHAYNRFPELSGIVSSVESTPTNVVNILREIGGKGIFNPFYPVLMIKERGFSYYYEVPDSFFNVDGLSKNPTWNFLNNNNNNYNQKIYTKLIDINIDNYLEFLESKDQVVSLNSLLKSDKVNISFLQNELSILILLKAFKGDLSTHELNLGPIINKSLYKNKRNAALKLYVDYFLLNSNCINNNFISCIEISKEEVDFCSKVLSAVSSDRFSLFFSKQDKKIHYPLLKVGKSLGLKKSFFKELDFSEQEIDKVFSEPEILENIKNKFNQGNRFRNIKIELVAETSIKRNLTNNLPNFSLLNKIKKLCCQTISRIKPLFLFIVYLLENLYIAIIILGIGLIIYLVS